MYAGNRLKPSESRLAQRWLSNFASQERDDARLLVDSLQIATAAQVASGVLSEARGARAAGGIETPALALPVLAMEDVKRAINWQSEDTPVAYDDFPVTQPLQWAGGSENSMGHYLRDLLNSPTDREYWISPSASIGDLRAARVRSIVLFSDYAGSGKQVQDFASSILLNPTIRSWRSLGYLRIYAITFAASRQAQLRMAASREVSKSWNAVTARSFDDCGWSNAERVRIEQLCKRYGVDRGGRLRSDALGFRASRGLYLDERKAPNNLPWVLRRAGKNWQSLFSGRDVPEEFVREVGRYEPDWDLMRAMGALGEMRLADSLLRRSDRLETQKMATLLAAFAVYREVARVAELTYLHPAEVHRLAVPLERLGLLGADRRLTRAGQRELDRLQIRRRVQSAGLYGVSDNYYPSSLRWGGV